MRLVMLGQCHAAFPRFYMSRSVAPRPHLSTSPPPPVPDDQLFAFNKCAELGPYIDDYVDSLALARCCMLRYVGSPALEGRCSLATLAVRLLCDALSRIIGSPALTRRCMSRYVGSPALQGKCSLAMWAVQLCLTLYVSLRWQPSA